MIHDVNRPDVNGTPAKMQAICDKVKAEIAKAPFLKVKTDDNIMSSVTIHGSFMPQSEWSSGIYQNSLYFIIFIRPQKGQRYYSEGEKVTVELGSVAHELPNTKLRKYTGPIEKVIEKINAWIESNRPRV